MRRNSVRHFVHMVIDILPLLIIPIFALNILHKDTEPISITIDESYYSYDYLFDTNEVQSNADLVQGNIYQTTIPYTELQNDRINIGTTSYFCVKNNLIEETMAEDSNAYSLWYEKVNTTWGRLVYYYDDKASHYNVAMNEDLTIYFVYNSISSTFTYTISESTYLPVEYTYHENEPVVYNNTDIGSQFIYALYKPVHDYFNFNNLFNMGAIYDWIQLNLFSGTAPLPIFIIWNVIVYEFFVDLIFLLYAVFMFVIDFSTSMIDRFMYKSRRGI